MMVNAATPLVPKNLSIARLKNSVVTPMDISFTNSDEPFNAAFKIFLPFFHTKVIYNFPFLNIKCGKSKMSKTKKDVPVAKAAP